MRPPVGLVLIVTFATAAPAAAADADVFRRGTEWCASTYAGHDTLEGFGPPLDIKVRDGSSFRRPLYAPGNGRARVYSRGWGDGWGNSVIWRSARGGEELHLSHLDSFGKTGRVRAGDLIGRIGSTGRSTGPHLHIARRVDGVPKPVRLMDRRIRAGGCYTSTGPIPIRCGGRTATIVGTRGADVLRGTRGADVIAGLGGDDRISGGGGNDVICGGAGHDRLVGGPGSDRLLGGAGADRLVGGRGNDRLLGGDGRDRLDGGPGDDALLGGSGSDTALYRSAPRGVEADLGAGTASGWGADVLRDIEELVGSDYADVLTGGPGDDVLRGRSGDDLLDGADGMDLLDGGPGVDVCVNGEVLRACEP